MSELTPLLLPIKLVLTLCFSEPQQLQTLELYNPLTQELVFVSSLPAASTTEYGVSTVTAYTQQCENLVLDEYTTDDSVDCEVRAATLRAEIADTDYIGCVLISID